MQPLSGKMYKVFEECDGQPKFLYHGLAGSRLVPLDQWVGAEIKWIKEGSNPHYWSGFHLYASLDAIRAWVRRTKHRTGRVLVEVLAHELTKKPTRGAAYLAHRMKISSAQWARRVPLESL